MFKKTLAIAALICTIPAIASASWFLTTQAKNAGGTIASDNGSQVVTDGAITHSYTAQTLPITATPATGNSLRSLVVTARGLNAMQNYTTIVSNVASGYTIPSPQNGWSYNVAATFQADSLTVVAGNNGGTVTPSKLGNLFYGYKLVNPLTFTFAPMAGYTITGITGAPAEATVVVPNVANKAATVTFPAGYQFTSSLDMEASAVNTTPAINHILPQTVVIGSSVNLGCSVSNIASPTYAWSYASGPANTTQYVGPKAVSVPGPDITLAGADTANASFTAPSVPGQYKFLVTVGNLTSLATVNVVAQTADAANQCQFCHTANNVGAPTIGTDWQSSDHQANGVLCSTCHTGADSGSHPGSTWGTAALSNVCLNCHNSTSMPGDPEGPNYLKSAHYNNPYGEGVVYCSSCHNPHQPVMQVYSSNHQVGFYTTGSTPTNVCTKCHTRSPGRPYGLYSSNGVGMAPHFDPTNSGAVAFTNNRTCTDCHGHNNAINGEWAQSGHGDVTSSAWNEGGASSPCVRCHTTTGFINYSSFRDVAPLTTPIKKEVLGCVACHTSPDMPYSPFGNLTTVNGVTGSLRPIKPYPATYTQSGTTVNFQFPDVGVSNVCVPCHSGRVSGGNIQKASGLNNTSFFNSHYRAAAGVFYKSTGFQFYTSSAQYANPTGQDPLGNPAYYEHFLVGTNNVTADGVDAADTGTLGPCVACHMSNQNDGGSVASSTNPGHTLHIFSKDSNGRVTGVNNDICIGCHVNGGDPGALDFTDGNGNFSPDNVNAQIDGFNASLTALQAMLQTKGIYYTSATYPYFFTSAAYTTATKDWTLGTNDNAQGKNNMGAAFNLNMLTREPGAYAHNRYYTKRLIFDAIDWLQNGSLTGSINVAAIPDGASDGLGGTTPVFDINAATSYLGTTRP